MDELSLIKGCVKVERIIAFDTSFMNQNFKIYNITYL